MPYFPVMYSTWIYDPYRFPLRTLMIIIRTLYSISTQRTLESHWGENIPCHGVSFSYLH